LSTTPRRRVGLFGAVFLALAVVGWVGMPVAAAVNEWAEAPAFLALALCGTLGYLEERRG
jgi:hypothetical protein